MSAPTLQDIIKSGSTNQSVLVAITNSSNGEPDETVVYTDAITFWYRREGGLRVDFSPAQLTALDDAHVDGGFLHIDDGYYRLDVPDAAFAVGASHVDLGGNMAGEFIEIGRIRLSLIQDIFNEILSKANYNIANSAGRFIRNIAQSNIATEGEVDDGDGSATTTSFKTDLTAADDIYNDSTIVFTSGNLEGLSSPILDYAQTDGLITLDPDEQLPEVPANGDQFVIRPDHVHPISQIAEEIAALAVSGNTDSGSFGELWNATKIAVDALESNVGAGMYTITLDMDDDGGSAIADMDVVVNTNSSDSNDSVVASGRTNINGKVTFYLDDGTYYVWRQKTGKIYTNPKTLTVASGVPTIS